MAEKRVGISAANFPMALSDPLNRELERRGYPALFPHDVFVGLAVLAFQDCHATTDETAALKAVLHERELALQFPYLRTA